MPLPPNVLNLRPAGGLLKFSLCYSYCYNYPSAKTNQIPLIKCRLDIAKVPAHSRKPSFKCYDSTIYFSLQEKFFDAKKKFFQNLIADVAELNIVKVRINAVEF